MRHRHHYPWTLLLAFLLMFSLTANEKTSKIPAVLFIGNAPGLSMSPEVLKEIHKSGFKIEFVNLKRGKHHWKKFEKLLPQTNVVVLCGAGTGNAGGTVDSQHQKLFKLINNFAKNGGGVLYLCSERYVASFYGGSVFLDTWGIQLGREYLYGRNPVEMTPWLVDYEYTANVKSSPVTKNVKGLWYAVRKEGKGLSSIHQSLGLVFKNPAWKIVIYGNANTYSKGEEANSNFLLKRTRNNGYQKNPPLFAIREFGKGRLAISAIQYPYFVGHAATTTLEGIVWGQGAKGKKSYGKQLIINTLKWLSRKNPVHETFQHNRALLRPRDQFPVKPAVDWSRREFSGKPQKSLNGIIGVRSAYSIGSGTVREWKKAAVAAGLDFLVFLEDFAHMTPAKLDNLKKECQKLSDNKILLLPGFTYENFIGMKCYNFDANIPWPPKKMLAPDGKRFGDGIACHPKKWRGQLSYLRMMWQYGTCGRKVMTGWYNFKNMPVPYEDCGQYDTIPVVEAAPKHHDNTGFTVFKKACRDKQYPEPVALEFLNNPGQLIKPDLWKTFFFFNNLKDFSAWLDRHGYSARAATAGAKAWVSNGPVIVNWDVLGNHDYSFTNRDAFVWQNALRKIRLKAKSDAELKEVRIWDGTKLYRHFKCSGKAFEVILDFDKRDQQRELLAEVIDRKGRRAVTGILSYKSHYLQQVNCSDRNNQLASSHQRRRDESRLKLSHVKAVTDKRTGFMFAKATSPFSADDRLGFSAFDGPGPVKYPTINEALFLNIKENHRYKQRVFQSNSGEEENGSHQISSCVSATMDAMTGKRFVDSVFTDNVDVIHVWSTMWKLKPRKYSTWTEFRTVLRPRPDEPLYFLILRYKLKLKKSIKYVNNVKLGIMASKINPAKSRLWSIGPAGSSFKPVASGKYNSRTSKAPVTTPFGTGAWAACLGGDAGGVVVFSLSPGLRLVTSNLRKPRFQIGIPPENSPTKAGQEVEFTVAMVGIPRYVKGYTDRVAQADPVVVPAAIKKSLGIGCEPLYKVDWIRGKPGKVNLICPVTAENGAVIAKFEKCPKLIAPIPVQVSGLNSNWTTVFLDRNRKQMRALGSNNGKALVMIDPQVAEQNIFIGQPIQSDNPEIILHLVQTGDKSWTLEIHNPTDKTINCNIKTTEGFDFLENLNCKLSLISGSSKIITLKK